MHRNEIKKCVKVLKGSEGVEIERLIDYYVGHIKKKFNEMSPYQAAKIIISELNYESRHQYKSSELVGFKVKVGDICYVDFGRAYINEAGYQHFGIVVGYCNSKALVIPMSSNYAMYQQSYCEKTFPNGKKHLYRLPSLESLRKKSVLFLNDMKYINTARIIEVKGNLDPKSELFKDILDRAGTLIKHN